jgi:hypothetical protein
MKRATFCASVYTGKIVISSICIINFLVAELKGSKQLKPQVLIGRLPDPAPVSFIVTNRLPYSIPRVCISAKRRRGETEVIWSVRSAIC